MSSTLGSANIGGNNYLGVWSGKPYQDPIGANQLPNQGTGPYGANSLNGHIGANWPQGPVLPPANDRIQSDHGPGVNNFNADIFWQTASGTWADEVNPGTPLVANFVSLNATQTLVAANPLFARLWQVGQVMTFSNPVNGAPASITWLAGVTGTIAAISTDPLAPFVVLTLDSRGRDLTGLASVVTVA